LQHDHLERMLASHPVIQILENILLKHVFSEWNRAVLCSDYKRTLNGLRHSVHHSQVSSYLVCFSK